MAASTGRPTRAAAIVLAATFVTGAVALDQTPPHVEIARSYPAPLLSSEYSYSTVAPPTFLDMGLWEFMSSVPPGVVRGSHFPAEYVSSLDYHSLPSYPLTVEPDHYEPNVRAHIVTGNNPQPEREAQFLATPFHPGPLENVEASASTPIVFARFDRKILRPHASVVITSRRPSKQNVWVQRRRNA